MELLNGLLDLLRWLIDHAAAWARRHPFEAFVIALAFLRLMGTTVESGWAGVLFTFGRVRRVLAPGFHPLLPLIQTVRKSRIRSITMDLPRQRVTTSDGLVFNVDTNLVFRVEDPIRAVVEIDNVKKGCKTLLALCVHDVLRSGTQETLMDRKGLDEKLAGLARAGLARWGLVVEHAGFTSIAPTAMTLRLTQLRLRAAARYSAYRELRARGVESRAALGLVASDRVPQSHSRRRYRAGVRRARLPWTADTRRRNERAALLLATAERAFREKRWSVAYRNYKELATRYADTEAYLGKEEGIRESLREIEATRPEAA